MSPDLGRIEIPPLFQFGIAAATIMTVLMGILVLRLNRSHARLRARLEEQLAATRAKERALRESEVFYHSLVESLPQSILRKDREGRFTFCNRNFSREMNLTPEQVQGKNDFDFYPRELAVKYREDDARVIEAGQPFEAVEEHITPSGHVIYVHVTKTPLYDSSGRVIGIQGIFGDVTERKRAEELLQTQNQLLQEMAESERQAHEDLKKFQSHLVQSEKLAGLGQMVAGVAHEINNPLSFVGNNVAVLQRDLGEMVAVLALYREGEEALEGVLPDLVGRIREIRDRVDLDYSLENLPRLLSRTRDGLARIQQIVKDLRIFARLDEGSLNEVDLNEGILSTIGIIQGHAKKKRVQVETDLHNLPAVTCFAAKINQVIMNLVMNAIDACDEGGAVTIRSLPENDNEGVRIDVIDHGCGIDPIICERIFDPFFTTKPVGVGTGLGLSISYGIIQDHGGSIEVESIPGQGSRFTIHLATRMAVPSRQPARPEIDRGEAAESPPLIAP
ncbi:PAS domain-containing sensor histidine kinase [Tundrisphaera lichenicola]|uniref:PAS domain-containing sensor histidine kinase n=1 Tax=Tundrisphaera lichenicola TaxID=2029860 RepID=UPI003EBF8903